MADKGAKTMTANRFVMTVLVIAGLSGCAAVNESRLNPLNWFGSDEESLDPIAVENERRPLVAQITGLAIERTPGGAIIRATALPPTQGWFDAELVSADQDGEPVDGVLSFAFRAVPPETHQRQSTERSRELSAAVFVSNIVLAKTQTVQVTGQQNSRAIRR